MTSALAWVAELAVGTATSSSSSSSQSAKELAKAVEAGDLVRARGVLARAATASQDQEEYFAVNALSDGGLTPLQLAAKYANVDMLQLLLTEGGDRLDVNKVSDAERTALHYAAASPSRPFCTECVKHLLARKADPCMASRDDRTPLDLARESGCPDSIKELEDAAVLWQGWVEHCQLVLRWVPQWSRCWLVVLRDRRSNTGSGCRFRGKAHETWQGVYNTVAPQVQQVAEALGTRMATPSITRCPRCSQPVTIRDFVSVFLCGACGAELVVPASLQLAVYDATPGDAGSVGRPNYSTAARLVQRLPLQPDLVKVEELSASSSWNDSATAAKDLLFRTISGTALAQTAASLGIAVKVLDGRKRVQVEHQFRLCSEAERASLQRALQPQELDGIGLMIAAHHAKMLQDASAASPTPQVHTAGPDAARGGRGAGNDAAASAAAASAGPPSKTSHYAMAAPRQVATACGSQAAPAQMSAPTEADAALSPVAVGAACGAAQPPTIVHKENEGQVAKAADSSKLQTENKPDGGDADDDRNMCSICFERKSDAAVVPCGHKCACFGCLESLKSHSIPECPVCRGPLQAVLRIYES
mmetsp:Transcript_10070/g.22628  ORF Transcript_10070/g.22628 Transcript_10070/m.22628 type:complete len:589 (-) Transcript_10070:47-1813(-)